MSNFGITHQSFLVSFKIIATPHAIDYIAEDLKTGMRFKLDPTVGASLPRALNVGDIVEAVIHPCEVVFAIRDLEPLGQSQESEGK